MTNKYGINYSLLPGHMQGGAQRYLECGIKPGDFLLAALANDLVGAFCHADNVNSERMRDWANWLYNECPSAARGSREKVKAWIASGGLDAQVAKSESAGRT